MTKTYFNDAIIGNSSMLGCLTSKGELVRLFWPNIDYSQHIEKMAAGIFFTNEKNSTVWLHEDMWQHHQHYIKDTNILKTICENSGIGLRIIQTDFVLPERDILIRRYEIQNTGNRKLDIGFILYSSAITTNSELRSTLFDFGTDALIHYRHGYYISISADRDVRQFQLGNNSYDSAKYSELGGYENIGMMQDGAASWSLGGLDIGEKVFFTLHICASHSLKGVKSLTREMKNADAGKMVNITRDYWTECLEAANSFSTSIAEADELYKRSILVFMLMSDKKTGGLLASAEIDEGFTRCGRYAYCWGRDAAFITGALDKCGLTKVVDKFYRWAVETQDEDGSWQQRYHMDGNLAPSWGLQIDETGTLIWGMLKHYEETKEKSFLEYVWRSVRRGVEFIIGFIDNETGLPMPSYDLWEERLGVHAYSSAAVYGGIMAGIEIARILKYRDEEIDAWKSAALSIKDAIIKNFWRESSGRYIRSIRTKMNPWGSEHSHKKVYLKVNPKGYIRDFTLEDWCVDVSLLGLSVPFDVFEADDSKFERTADIIESVLTSPVVGGIKRYESDNYIGGNPWVLASLWAALYHIKKKNYEKAKEYFNWAIKSRTKLSFLPEQVSKENGEPAWVIPLTWSHAMYVLVYTELAEARQI